MELYRVTIEYRDVHAERQWEAQVSRHTNREPPPKPPRKSLIWRVAVEGGFGGAPIARAADLAIESAVAKRERWPDYQPVVTAVVHEGSVRVDALRGEED